jgi:hypothetical protein
MLEKVNKYDYYTSLKNPFISFAKRQLIFCNSFVVFFSRLYILHLSVSQVGSPFAYWTYIEPLRWGHVIPNTLMIKLTGKIIHFFKTNEGTPQEDNMK